MPESVDVVVIGMGPGGSDVAERLAEAGLAVVGVDARLVGGECPYYGCVPTKMMIRAANSVAEARRVPVLAGHAQVEPDFAPVADRIRDEATDNWDDQVAVDRFTAKGGRFVRGHGRLVGSKTVRVSDSGSDVDFIARRAIVLNTGTDPAVLPIPGLAGTPYWTNREIIPVRQVPETLLVLGGGAIGCELAQVFARFGSRVSVIEAAPRLLALEEPESSAVLAAAFAADGIGVHVDTAAKAVRYDAGAFTVELADQELTGDALLVATGRRTTVAGLGVDVLGLDPDARVLDPDEYLRIADGVYAIGDITGKGAFTHMSMYQAGIVVRHILGEPGHGAEYHAVPRVTFTDPEIGAVGLTEAMAIERGLRLRIGSSQLPESTRGWIHKAGNAGFIKLVEDADRGVLVGATSAGPSGGEVLSALTVAVHAEVPTERLSRAIYAYPTFHRAIEAAVATLR